MNDKKENQKNVDLASEVDAVVRREPHTLIQSYVYKKYFVSTAYRKSSAMINSPPWYYETLTWEWNPNTGDLGKILESEDSGGHPNVALENHCLVCKKLSA